MKYILVIISIIFMTSKSYSFPNGLAFIVSKDANDISSYAHGVIVDGKLITSAHVFVNSNPTHIFVVQDNVLVNIVPSGSVKVHPRYMEPDSNLVNIDLTAHDQDQLSLFRLLSSLPYDLAFTEVNSDLKSDFILPSTETFQDYFNFEAQSRATDAVEMVVRFKASELNDGEPLEGRVLTKEYLVEDPTSLGTLAAHISFNSITQGIDIKPGMDANVIMYPENLLRQGHSGSPLTIKTKEGKYLIVGLSSAITTLEMAGGSDTQTFFTPQMEITAFVRANTIQTVNTCSLILK